MDNFIIVFLLSLKFTIVPLIIGGVILGISILSLEGFNSFRKKKSWAEYKRR